MRLAHAFRQCAEIEARIAAIYDRFARRWAGAGDIGDFWRRMADEERTHAKILEAAAAQLSGSKRRGPIDAEAIATIRGYVTAVSTSLGVGPGPDAASLRGSGPVAMASLAQAFRTAFRLETLELDRVYLRLLDLAADAVRDAAGLPAAALEPHEEELFGMIERRSDDPELVAEVRRVRLANRERVAGVDDPLSRVLATVSRLLPGSAG